MDACSCKPWLFGLCDSGHMKVATRNSNRVCSNYSTDSKDSGDSAEKKSSSDSPVIELNQTVCHLYNRKYMYIYVQLHHFLSMPFPYVLSWPLMHVLCGPVTASHQKYRHCILDTKSYVRQFCHEVKE